MPATNGIAVIAAAARARDGGTTAHEERLAGAVSADAEILPPTP
jgi:hypothetical protein